MNQKPPSAQVFNDSTNSPKVSVIMNCLNCEKYVKEAIDTVYGQTYSSWEIIFWDNASADRSAEIAKSYDHRLRYFRGEETIPLGAARNRALERARGEFVAFLDSDDVWMPQKLEKQIPLFNDPKIGLVFCDTIFFNEKGKIQRLYEKKPYHTGWCFPALLSNYFLSLETVVIRRSILDIQEKWFDSRFNMIEEADFFRRISCEWKLAMVNEPLAKWRVHSASWTWSKSHLFAEETSLMLADYREIFPNFSEKFAKEIRVLECQININKAMNLLKSGNGYKARSHLLPYIFFDMKVFGLFLISFLPKGLFSFILKLKNTTTPI